MRLGASFKEDDGWKFRNIRDLKLFNGIAIRIKGIEVSTDYALMSCLVTEEPTLPYKAILNEKLHELIRMAPAQ